MQSNEIELCVHGVVPTRVKLLERLHSGQKQIRGHCVGHQFGDLPNGRILDLQARRMAENLQEHHQHRRPGAKR
jgi:hypothetical protein